VDAELSEDVMHPRDSSPDRGGRAVEAVAAPDLADLFRTHRNRLVRLAFAITLDAAVAEEMVQDAFVGLQRNAARIDNPVGYLQRSVVNLSVSVIRRRRLIELKPLLTVVEAMTSSPEIDEMWAKVVRLPAKQRAVVVLRFWEDMSLAEIARVLRRPTGSVKSTLHRAIQSLKEELA